MCLRGIHVPLWVTVVLVLLLYPGASQPDKLTDSGAVSPLKSPLAATDPMRVGVLHYRAQTTPKHAFEVGFRSALQHLHDRWNVEIVEFNLAAIEGLQMDSPELTAAISSYGQVDVLLVKSNWDWIVDTFARQFLRNTVVPKVLLISGVGAVPAEKSEVLFYDALMYETEWYAQKVHLKQKHPVVLHGFGIDTHIMHPTKNRSMKWDIMFVGWMAPYKRLHKFVERVEQMRRHDKRRHVRALAVGKLDATDESADIVKMLRAAGIEVWSEVSYAELAGLLSSSRELYIPSGVNGGGERAVLEARACNVSVHVASDNPKLQTLAAQSTPVYDHYYYADQIRRALAAVAPGSNLLRSHATQSMIRQIPNLGISVGQHRLPLSLSPQLAADMIQEALALGYEHINIHTDARSTTAIGKLFARIWKHGTKSAVPGMPRRSDVFISVTMDLDSRHPATIPGLLEAMLAELGLSYIDLLLLKTPSISNGSAAHSIHKLWSAAGYAVQVGLAKQLGVADTPAAMIQEILTEPNIPAACKPAVSVVHVTPQTMERRLMLPALASMGVVACGRASGVTFKTGDAKSRRLLLSWAAESSGPMMVAPRSFAELSNFLQTMSTLTAGTIPASSGV